MRTRDRYLLVFLVIYLGVLGSPSFASRREIAAADAVATAFSNARQAAHLPKLKRMVRNPFQKQVCSNDMRLPSGEIDDVLYETSDPAQLPKSARQLATRPDRSRTAARFGVGVCFKRNNTFGRPTYTVFVATYESRWTSFWRIFWE
jgi:hypothetical protein